MIVNRGTGALTANALAAKPAEKHQEHGGDFFFSLMALSNAGGGGVAVAFTASFHTQSRMCWDIKHFLS